MEVVPLELRDGGPTGGEHEQRVVQVPPLRDRRGKQHVIHVHVREAGERARLERHLRAVPDPVGELLDREFLAGRARDHGGARRKSLAQRLAAAEREDQYGQPQPTHPGSSA